MIIISNNRVLLLIAFFLIPFVAFSQGKLMLVGGGGESSGGWSNAPYAWMVANAENKKIGIISYSDEDNWLPNYFKALGASEADNIKIDSRAMASESLLLDSLTQYDGLFFKGGDQNRYYEYYRNTFVQTAIEEIYNRGGVIAGTSAGMAILSGVIFTASNGSAYPLDAISDINSSYITLENNFLSFYPDFIFDTHFIERGRTPRLIGFMAHWYENNDEFITGIGVDDRTALCIDSEGVAQVYGTGAASIYLPKAFTIEDGKIMDSNVKAIQLTHSQSIDLNTAELSSRAMANFSEPNLELPYYQVYASTENTINRTRAMLEEALSNELMGGKLLIVSNQNNSRLGSFKQFFEERTTTEIIVLEISDFEGQDLEQALRNNIRQSSMLVFLEPTNLIDYFSSGPTGELLSSHMKRNKITNVFLGDISNQLGRYYANNLFQDPLNAYFDDINYSEGLNMLKDFHIIGGVFSLNNRDYYENLKSSVVDRVLNDQLKYGVMMTGNAYFSYTISDSDQALMKIEGDLSAVLIENNATYFEQTDQTVSGSRSRLQYAFDSLTYKISSAREYQIGQVSPQSQQDYEFESEEILSVSDKSDAIVRILQNPAKDILRLKNESQQDFQFQILRIDGKSIFNDILKADIINEYNIAYLPPAQYIILVEDRVSKIKYHIKFIKTQ